MPPFDPLCQLKQSSPEFSSHLTNIFREQAYRDYVTSLQSDDSAWLVEYLENVRICVALTNSLPKVSVGPRYPRPHRSCIPEMPV